MPDKRIPLSNGEYYHVFNRGIARMPTFLSPLDYKQAFLDISYYRFNNPPIRLSYLKRLLVDQREEILLNLQEENDAMVKIISYSFMPNHFHLLLQQISENGISTFLSKFTNSYTRYFNTKEDRIGPLFQGLFKAVYIETWEQLLHVSRYIHLNPLIGFVVKEKDFLKYPYSSLPDFLKGESSVITLDPILQHFSPRHTYKQFILDQVEYSKTLNQIKHLTLE